VFGILKKVPNHRYNHLFQSENQADMADTIMEKAGHPLDYMYIIMTKLFGDKK